MTKDIIQIFQETWSSKQVAEFSLSALEKQGKRALSLKEEDGGLYLDPQGNKCTVGLLLPENSKILGFGNKDILQIINTSLDIDEDEFEAIYNYQEILQELQIYHDSLEDANWACCVNLILYVGRDRLSSLMATLKQGENKE